MADTLPPKPEPMTTASNVSVEGESAIRDLEVSASSGVIVADTAASTYMIDFKAMNKLPEFKLERFFGEWEFRARYLLSPSDCESMSVAELLALADEDGARRWREFRLGYTETHGDPTLRPAIAPCYTPIPAPHVLAAAPGWP